MSAADNYAPGEDAKAISRVAKDFYGDFRQMFDAHGWDAPGEKMMTTAPALIVERYGSIRAFEAAHEARYPPDDVWDRGYSVFFTSFWGWSPETWGTIGWTGDRGRTRRRNMLEKLTDPFIAVCYVTSNKSEIDPALKGKIAGFYLVSHQTGDRDEFTHPYHHHREIDKWRHSLRALRAFSYLPEYRLEVTDFDPGILARARSVAAMGEIISDPEKLKLLRDTPWEEVDVYTPVAASQAVTPGGLGSKGMVPAGPANGEGYVVANGTQWLPRALYVLRLEGDTNAYLGKSAAGRTIVKIGLSASPDLRRQALQKSMPEGAFKWRVDRTTVSCGMPLYPNHSVAVQGEDAMKKYLAAHADWLGGEFYLVTEEEIDAAWQSGCRAASNGIE